MKSKVKKIKDFVVVIAIVFLNCIMTYGAMKINYDAPVYNAYKDGEPDYADGDLEDKLGDSGYYYDLFPEERDGELDDYQSSKSNNNSKKSTNYDSNFSIADDYIRNHRGCYRGCKIGGCYNILIILFDTKNGNKNKASSDRRQTGLKNINITQFFI